MVGARRFQPRTSVRSGATSVRACVRIAASSTGDASLASRTVSSSSLMTMRWSPGAMTVSIGGLSVGFAVGRAQPDQSRILEGEECVAERLPDQLGDAREVDLVAVEVEQLGVDDRQPGLATGLGDDPRDEVARQDELGLGATDQAGDIHVRCVAQLGDDVVRLRAAPRVVGHGEHRLDDVGVGIVVLGRQDDDRSRRLEPRDLEVVDIHRVARAADDRGPAGARQAGPDLVVHLALVPVGQDDDRAALEVLRWRRPVRRRP